MRKNKRNNTQKTTTPSSASTGTSTVASSLPDTPSPGSSSTTSYHRSAYSLPLHLFIEIGVTEDLAPLIISGTPTVMELQDAFEAIISEFSSIVQNDKSDAILKMSRRLGLMQWEIMYVDYAIYYLEKLFALKQITHPETCTQLRRLGYDYKFDPANAYQYRRELGFVRSRAKGLIDQRADLLGDYQRLTTAGSTGKKKTRETYEVELAELSAYQGYKIDKFTTTVAEYAAVLARYNLAVKAAKQQRNGKK